MIQREHKGINIVALPNSYTVIDVETTGLDFELCEIIEVSALRVRDGVVTEEFSSLVQPDLSFETDDCEGEKTAPEFVPEFITKLTGITNPMLAAAPLPADILPKFLQFVGNDVVVGHNVSFDVNFLYDACAKLGLFFSNDYIDTMRIARKLLPDLEHHRLKDLANHFNLQHDRLHRALSDCHITAQCYSSLKAMALEQYSSDDFLALFKPKHIKLDAKSIVPEIDCFDDTHPFYQKTFAFTGALSSLRRKDAMQLVANLGGFNGNGVTAKTNFLVVGSEEFCSSVKGGKSNKMLKAEALMLKGQDITVLSENAFLSMVNL